MARNKPEAPDDDSDQLSRQEIVDAMERYAGAYGKSATDVVKRYRQGTLQDVTDYTPLLALSRLLARNDPLSAG